MAEILLVEDSPEIAAVIRRALAPEDHVTAIETIKEARDRIRQTRFEMVLLDVMLPDGDGFEFFAEVKEALEGEVPVIFVSGKTEVSTQATGILLGAEDYIVKPIEPLLLRAKVRSRLQKQRAAQTTATKIEAGDIRIDVEQQRVYVKGVEVPLTGTEYRLVLHFLRNRDRVLSRDQLMTAVWGENTHVLDRTVDTHISHVRSKLRSEVCMFEPVYGSGYRFVQKKL